MGHVVRRVHASRGQGAAAVAVQAVAVLADVLLCVVAVVLVQAETMEADEILVPSERK